VSPDFRWITPMYGFNRDHDHVGVSEGAMANLMAMASDLVGLPGLVAIYIPEGTQDVYEPGSKRGRVVGAVRLTPMPSGCRVADYFYNDWDGTRRWPIGWPCSVVYAPEVSLCPSLREHVEHVFGPGSFRGYVTRFQRGPFRLEAETRERLNRDFARFKPLCE
jgi:hypothetical protein